MSYGFKGHIGLAKETTWGTPVAATDYMRALSESLNASIDRFNVVNIAGQFGEPADEAGLKRIAGDLSFAANPVTLGFFLKAALQTKSLTVIASGNLFTNDFLTLQPGDEFSADCALQPLTFEIFRDVTSSVQYSGCALDTLSLNFTPNQDVRVSASFIGKDEASIASTTPTFVSSPARPFKFDTSSVQIGGAANANLEALTVEIQNNLEGIPKLNNTDVVAAIRMNDFQMVNISGSIEFLNLTEYDNFIAQTEQALVVSVTKANSFALVVDIPQMVYTAFPTQIPGRQRLSVDFTGKGFYHTASLTAIRIALTTTNSLY